MRDHIVPDRTQVIRGNALDLPLPDSSVDLVITSPPYFALRSYRDGDQHYDGQIGSEATPQEFLESLWAATREMVRVLKPTGSIWVNLGDKYAGSGGHNNGAYGVSGLHKDRPTSATRDAGRDAIASIRNAPDRYNQSATFEVGRRIDKGEQRYVKGDVPKKSLMGLPWRYAIGCVDQLGLILRAEVIWSKPNGLPESVTDRVRRSHEQWFHMVKSPRYFAAVDEVREPHSENTHGPGTSRVGKGYQTRQNDGGGNAGNTVGINPLGKLPGSVWTIPSEPLVVPDAVAQHYGLPDHFAAFPTEWPRRIILGWSPNGVCVQCGEGRRPVVEKEGESTYAQLGKRNGSHVADLERRYGGDWNARTATGAVPHFEPRPATITGYACACTPYTDHPENRGQSFHAPGRDPAAGHTANAAERSSAYRNGEAGPSGPVREYHLAGWTPPPTRPAVVLDPFGGTGTVAMVARVLGRVGISVDLSADYCRLAEWRIFRSGHGAKVEERTWADRQGSLEGLA